MRKSKSLFLPHFCFPWGHPWGNHAKCCMDGKRIRCLQIVSLHVPITGSAVALRCVKALRQSQWRSPNFNTPLWNLHPLNFQDQTLPTFYLCAKFHCNIFTGSFPANMWNITFLWLFCCPLLSCPVLSWLYFFSRNSAQVEPLDGF